jgi:hypothetical protein
VEIHGAEGDKVLCYGRINSDTEVLLRRDTSGEGEEGNDLLSFKYDAPTDEWTIAFPELETVAYLIKPKPTSRVSNTQVYEIFSADNCSNYFNLGVEMEKSGNSSSPDYVFRVTGR